LKPLTTFVIRSTLQFDRRSVSERRQWRILKIFFGCAGDRLGEWSPVNALDRLRRLAASVAIPWARRLRLHDRVGDDQRHTHVTEGEADLLVEDTTTSRSL
jgi:hypothetical protein